MNQTRPASVAGKTKAKKSRDPSKPHGKKGKKFVEDKSALLKISEMVNCLHDAKVQEQRQKAAAKIQPIEEKKEAVRTKRADKIDSKKHKLKEIKKELSKKKGHSDRHQKTKPPSEVASKKPKKQVRFSL